MMCVMQKMFTVPEHFWSCFCFILSVNFGFCYNIGVGGACIYIHISSRE